MERDGICYSRVLKEIILKKLVFQCNKLCDIVLPPFFEIQALTIVFTTEGQFWGDAMGVLDLSLLEGESQKR